jgi:drug/metabolite transporter (DMT)-like permease
MSPILGALTIILANVFYAVTHTLVKVVGDSVPMSMVMLSRFMAGPILILPYLLYLKEKPFQVTNWPMLTVRIVCGVLAMAGFLWSLVLIEVAKATLLFSFSTVWALLLSVILFKETPSIQTKVAIPVSFIGLALVLQPTNLYGIGLGEVLALIASLFNAGVVLSLKILRQDNGTGQIVFANYFASSCLVIGPAAAQYVPPTLWVWAGLISIGVIGLIGQLLMTLGYKFTPASIAGSVSLIVVPLMFISGVVFFNEVPDILSIVGGSIILFCLILITRYQ